METFSIVELMKIHAKNTSKWCMLIHHNWKYGKDIYKAAPYLKEKYPDPLVIPEKLILTFDSEKEMEKCFNLTVGLKGPTKYNSYKGECRVNALTCSNTGILLNENT